MNTHVSPQIVFLYESGARTDAAEVQNVQVIAAVCVSTHQHRTATTSVPAQPCVAVLCCCAVLCCAEQWCVEVSRWVLSCAALCAGGRAQRGLVLYEALRDFLYPLGERHVRTHLAHLAARAVVGMVRARAHVCAWVGA